MPRRIVWPFLMMLTWGTALPSAAEMQLDKSGRELYMRYCASCHGELADGHGPVAPFLRVAPADLTRLADRYGWPLPRQVLAEFIDGRRDVPAHGTREMPVWGEQLEPMPPGPDSEQVKENIIGQILDFLETLQGRTEN